MSLSLRWNFLKFERLVKILNFGTEVGVRCIFWFVLCTCSDCLACLPAVLSAALCLCGVCSPHTHTHTAARTHTGAYPVAGALKNTLSVAQCARVCRWVCSYVCVCVCVWTADTTQTDHSWESRRHWDRTVVADGEWHCRSFDSVALERHLYYRFLFHRPNSGSPHFLALR